MKVAVLNTYDAKGGAARAAFRINDALFGIGIDSKMLVDVKKSSHKNITGYSSSFMNIAKHSVAKLITAICSGGDFSMKSIALFDSKWPAIINKSSFSLVHLNWLNAEMMSIEDIQKIKKPIVWTIHDMWPFCGVSHYEFDGKWQTGYGIKDDGILQSWIWKRKAKSWKRPIHIVCPSNWLSNCVKNSALMKSWPVSVIPNAIDTDFWHPVNKVDARKKLNLRNDSKVIMFGAIGSLNNHIKGFDLLLEALNILAEIKGDQSYEMLIVGNGDSSLLERVPIPSTFIGHVNDDQLMRECYSSADVVVVPSRLEAFGQVASEAQSCGTPVVAFKTSGLIDVVAHMETGYLAKAFDTEDLAMGINLLCRGIVTATSKNRKEKSTQIPSNENFQIGEHARKRVIELFSYPVVAHQYQALYQSVLNTA